jgi:hypothetical protein
MGPDSQPFHAIPRLGRLPSVPLRRVAPKWPWAAAGVRRRRTGPLPEPGATLSRRRRSHRAPSSHPPTGTAPPHRAAVVAIEFAHLLHDRTTNTNCSEMVFVQLAVGTPSCLHHSRASVTITLATHCTRPHLRRCSGASKALNDAQICPDWTNHETSSRVFLRWKAGVHREKRKRFGDENTNFLSMRT